MPARRRTRTGRQRGYHAKALRLDVAAVGSAPRELHTLPRTGVRSRTASARRVHDAGHGDLGRTSADRAGESPLPRARVRTASHPAARVFDVRDYGAKSDGVTKNTLAFARAIQAASRAEGGRVLVPKGRYLTGPLHLESNIELHLADGAELLFSQDFTDYLPPVLTRWEGLEVMNYSPLIYARDCKNVAITGRGKLDGQGAAWWPWKKSTG